MECESLTLSPPRLTVEELTRHAENLVEQGGYCRHGDLLNNVEHRCFKCLGLKGDYNGKEIDFIQNIKFYSVG